MNSLQFYEDSYAYVHPITKIIVFFISSFLMMSSGNLTVETLVIGVMLLLVLNTKAYKVFIKFAIASIIFIGLDIAMYSADLSILFFIISKMGKMFLPTLMGFYILSLKTSSLEFMAAFNSIGIPKGFQVPFVVMLRFIPTVQEALKDIRRALKIRGITTKKFLKQPVVSFEYILVPTLMSCSQTMDELASATICRGFNHEKERTYVLSLKFRFVNFFVLSVYLGFVILEKVIL